MQLKRISTYAMQGMNEAVELLQDANSPELAAAIRKRNAMAEHFVRCEMINTAAKMQRLQSNRYAGTCHVTGATVEAHQGFRYFPDPKQKRFSVISFLAFAASVGIATDDLPAIE